MVNDKIHILVYVCEAVSHEYPFEIDSRNKKVLPRYPELGKKIDLASRCALEEALLIKERISHVEISAITAGLPEAEWILRTCLGLGADQAIHLVTDPLEYGDDYGIATLLAEYVNREKADLILCGDCTENFGYSQIGPILAELLGYPFLSGVIGLETGEEGRITAQRKVARGHRLRLQAPLPAVVSVNRMINLPRYISVHTQIKPLKKSIVKMDLPYRYARSMELVSVGPFKPRAKKSVVPSGENRLDFLMSGGTSSKEGRKILEGDLSEASEKIIQLLKEENIL